VLLALLLIAISSAYGIYSTMPRRRRERQIKRFADDAGFDFSRRFSVPVDTRALPFWALVPMDQRNIGSGCVGMSDGRSLLVFERSITVDEYEATIWRTCVAARLDISAPLLRIQPYDHLPAAYDLEEVRFEAEAFDRRWRTFTDDRRFASALIDQRMMAWLMTIGPCELEVGGAWVMAETRADGEASLALLLDAVDGFARHVPRAAISLYPS
jgi:hypothetical protein